MERSHLKSRGEVEASICDAITHFQQEYMGRGPKAIHAYLIDDLLVVRVEGALTIAEQQLANSLTSDKGRDLIKQVRTQLVESARHSLEPMIAAITGTEPRSLHYDISTRTGEEVLVFVLTESPPVRETARKDKPR
jgi:uncharacterized protein YbcI